MKTDIHDIALKKADRKNKPVRVYVCVHCMCSFVYGSMYVSLHAYYLFACCFQFEQCNTQLNVILHLFACL